MMSKAAITCALNGVLTDPKQHPVPVTPEQMAAEAKRAFEAGASIMHIHYRKQEEGQGRFPTWDPEVCTEINEAIRAACPGVILNMTTGVLGPQYDYVLEYLRVCRPEMAACNAGSLNYLKTKRDGSWAWPPYTFDNPVNKVADFINVMKECDIVPEFECFDIGIARSVGMYIDNGMTDHADYNFVMGVASGMPAEPDLLPLLLKYKKEGMRWQTTVIGRDDVWPVHRKAAELGGNLRTGLEDCFYLPSGEKADSNGPMIEALAQCARDAGREIASPDEAREMLQTDT
ncbi:MAG: 3-keto-5-aminohexanoate cleavage protein [Pseudomonadota bacterium]